MRPTLEQLLGCRPNTSTAKRAGGRSRQLRGALGTTCGGSSEVCGASPAPPSSWGRRPEDAQPPLHALGSGLKRKRARGPPP
eukprot:10413184-Alexandrium_andersonii.AAC.1